jgi:hypothetical protein
MFRTESKQRIAGVTSGLGDTIRPSGQCPTDHGHRHADDHDDTNADNQAHTGGMRRLAGARTTTVMRRGSRDHSLHCRPNRERVY